MNKKLIPLYPMKAQRDTIRLNAYCNGAWSIAYSFLWPEQTFSNRELETTRMFIRRYFENATDKSKAFVEFCERIILTGYYLKSKESYVIPEPSGWFNLNCPYGYNASKELLDSVIAKRQALPNYFRHYAIVASHYNQFVQRPCAKTFIACRKKLLSFHAHKLLQYFYNSILHFNYINQQV